MFIERRALDDLPPDAIVLEEDEALKHMQQTVIKWKPFQEAWALKLGSAILGGYNLLITTNVGSYFFDRMRLPRSGVILYFTLTAGTMGIFTGLMQLSFVQPSILLQKECISCVYSKALGIQLGMFTAYGLGTTFFLSALAADTIHTYPVPGFRTLSGIKESGKLFVKFTRRIQPRLTTFICIGSLLTYGIVKKQYSELVTLNQKLFEKDEELRLRAAEMRATRPKTNVVTR